MPDSFITKIVAALSDRLDVVVVVLIAAFFGFVRHLQEFLVPEPPAFRWFIAAAKCLTSVAAGGLAFFVLKELGAGENWRWIGISLAGWGGADAINAAKEAGFDWLRRKATQAPDHGSKG